MPAINISAIKSYLLVAAFFTVFVSCKYRPDGPGHGEKPIISFKSIEGIYYTEVARRQKNGLSFNEYGYYLSPDWKLRFVSDDSAALYSPVKKKFLNFPLALGTDSVFNTGRAFLKVVKMSKDSLLLELLEPKGDSIDIHKSRVSMLFYADNYIKNKLHSNIADVQKASRKDSIFIKGLVSKANANITKAFAAQQPVQLISKSPQVSIVKRKAVPDFLNKYSTADDYLDPTFDITINKAYQDFFYTFSVYVDNKGQMLYRKPLVGFMGDTEAEKSYIRISTAIMNTYLKIYLTTIPGQTLGFKHPSIITLNVRGLTTPKKR
jgi:hypothetical protein